MRILFFCNSTVFFTYTLLVMVCLASCDARRQKADLMLDSTYAEKGASVVDHAIGFDLAVYGEYFILSLIRHYDNQKDTISYVLAEENVSINSVHSSSTRIDVPQNRIALLHSTYLSFFKECDALKNLGSISEGKYIYDEGIYESVTSGKLPEIGYGETLDKERLLAHNTSLVITVGWPNVADKNQQMLQELGIPMMVFSDWQETSLLGRFEWIKVVGALTGNYDLAKEKFDAAVQEYGELKKLTKGISNRPRVICNLPYKGAWYMPGGNSYVSNMLQDAGADYIWSAEEGTGGLQLDFETVYSQGVVAEYWISPGFTYSLDEIIGTDERLKDFNAIKSKNVYNSNARMARDIANDYWESGISNPEIVLADLIKIFHPDLMPDHELYYFNHMQ